MLDINELKNKIAVIGVGNTPDGNFLHLGCRKGGHFSTIDLELIEVY